jgi:biopolymer transport protein ExbB
MNFSRLIMEDTVSNIIDLYWAGGFCMHFILAFGIFTIAFTVERVFALFINYKMAPQDLRKNLLNFIARGDMKGACDYIELSAKNTSIGRVAMTGFKLKSVGAGDEALQARMDEQITKEVSFYDKRTNFLSMFGNVATLFGLLGTVTGLIGSFAGAAASSPAERANLLSQGISEALYTTAFGLMVAIPALVVFAIFQSKTDKIVGDLTETSSQIYHDLLFYADTGKDVKGKNLLHSTEKMDEATISRS